jgi:hypothetical protein
MGTRSTWWSWRNSASVIHDEISSHPWSDAARVCVKSMVLYMLDQVALFVYTELSWTTSKEPIEIS